MPTTFSINGTTISETQAEHRFQRSELVHEMISAKPGFLINNGTGIFFLVILLVLACTWFIQFPDLVTSQARFTSINAPKEIISKVPGRIVKLFVKEGVSVTQGEDIGYMESTTNHASALQLEKQVISIEEQLATNDIAAIINLQLPDFNNLGDLQPDYENFQQATILFKNYLGSGFFIKKRQMLLRDLSYLKKMKYTLLQQKNLNTEDLSLSEENFNAHEYLNNEKVIANLEYRNEKSKLIGKKLSIPQINAALINNDASQNEKQKEIALLDKEIKEQKTIFEQSAHNFKSRINAWKNNYVFSAPVAGTIKFVNFLQENQHLPASSTVCFVNPGNSSYYAEMTIPQTNFGKVTVGQTVILKLRSYPTEEYGSIKGELEFVSNIPTDSGYLAKIKLSNGLRTSYNKQVQFREGLIATAEIVTKDMRLLQRIYYGLGKQLN